MAVHRGDIQKLIVNIPPRTLKSEQYGQMYPAWVLGHEPWHQFIGASYAHTLAERNVMGCRRIMQSEWYMQLFPNTRISDVQNQKDYFMTTQGGAYKGTGIGGTITGFGADTIVVDDILNPKEAMSDTVRVTAVEELRSTLFSRFNNLPKGKFIMIMQRLHEQDPTGDLLKDGGYTHLKLPAIAMQDIDISINNKTWHMSKGDLLFPARLPQAELDRLRMDMSEYHFQGQYLQDPVPLGGGEFKEEWLQFYANGGAKPREMNLVILVDPAGGEEINRKKRKLSDWTVMDVWGLAPDNNYYLLDRIRDKLNPTERVNTLFMLHRMWNEKAGKPPKVGYEKYGMMTDTHYIKEKQKQDGYNFPLVELGRGENKEERIRKLIPDMQNGRFFFPATLPYVDQDGRKFDLIEEMKGEMRSFPRARHDDMCFIAGTLIDTLNGKRPIEDIKIGDFVLTPDGFKKVLACGKTGNSSVINNIGLTGTPNHPIYTIDKSYIPLDTIEDKNEIVRNNLCGWIKIALVKSLSLMVSNTDGWAEAENIICRNPVQTKEEKILKVCMSQFGSFIQDKQYLKAMKFIIKMATHLIASMKILSVYRVISIRKFLKIWICKKLEKISKILDRLHQLGTNQKKAENGIVKTPKEIITKFLSRVILSVLNVQNLLLPKEKLCFALNIVDRSIEKRTDILTSITKKPVSHAKNNFTECPQVNTVQNHVQIEGVYNLSVEGPNCYFANNVLVHNCDVMAYLYEPDLYLQFPKPRASMVAKAYTNRGTSSNSWEDF